MNKNVRFKLLSYALFGGAVLASAVAFLTLPFQKAEPFYMMSFVFIAMGIFSLSNAPVLQKEKKESVQESQNKEN